MFKMQQIEFHVTHACNFQCEGCQHYSNYQVKGRTPFSEGKEWFSAWSKRVTPERLKLLGGEPTLHPELLPYVQHAADVWPSTDRSLYTNGYFLDRHPGLAELLAKTNTLLCITVHFDDQLYYEKLVPILRKWSALSKEHGFRFAVNEARYAWWKHYKGAGSDMVPYSDGNPRRSWEVCVSKYCTQLHENKLWKCPCLAYLGTIADKFDLHSKQEWKPYLGYVGIDVTSSDEELHRFLALEEESYCGMCPKELPQLIGHGKSPEARVQLVRRSRERDEAQEMASK